MKSKLIFPLYLFLITFLLAGCGADTSTQLKTSHTMQSFSISGFVPGVIDEVNQTITVNMPFGTNRTALVASFTSTGYAVRIGTVDQVSAVTPNDFSSPVNYRVVAEDGTRTTYTVTVNVAASHTVSGTLSGLASGSIVLQNNGADNLTLSANGTFTFATPITSAYNVTILTPPAGHACTLTYGAGTVSLNTVTNNNISGVRVICGTTGISTFTATGSMTTARAAATSTLLNNGLVLVVGGFNGTYLSSAQLYNPAGAGTWSSAGSLSVARGFHSATLLDNGKVLVAGGRISTASGAASYTATAELYNPTTNTWSTTGSMAGARDVHGVVKLFNGTVLVAGGWDGVNVLSTSELYDPVLGTWSSTGSLSAKRESSKFVLLPTGRVLAPAGDDGTYTLNSAELYNPSTGTWANTGILPGYVSTNTSTLLPNGNVLVAGGYSGAYLTTAYLYNTTAGTWSTTGSFTTGREQHTASLLPTGRVIIVGGGIATATYTATAQLYDPGAGTWSTPGSMASAKGYMSETLLPSGKLLVSGGYNGTAYISTAELYW